MQIRDEAADIAESGRGINDYTDSIMQLNRTNKLAASILASAQPLDASLTDVEAVAGDIDDAVVGIQRHAESIDSSARSINASAATILGDVTDINQQANSISTTAGGINADAAGILRTAVAIQRGIRLINDSAARAADVVGVILADARNINTHAVRTAHLARCIDDGLNGGSPC
ncbi:hypothetical protein [Nocardioides pelophilus]|uniref:hypothetical protein n=1 Tax=Nocardioides pelophilus TaxID=2172019 RepID=UPI001C812EA0|nr:hypothetical protein [Nocardioides pelophilus]